MAFLRKAGSILRQTTGRLGANISVFQTLRCMSSSKVFVGGLSFQMDDQALAQEFDKYGPVCEARIIMDRDSGRSRGFGFVTYESAEQASAAIQALDGQEVLGRRLRVNYATEKTRGYGGGYGAGGGGGYGGGGYNQGGDNYNQGYNQGGGGYNQGGGGYNQGGGSFGGNYSQESNLPAGEFGTGNQAFGGGADNYASPDAGNNNSFGNTSGFGGGNTRAFGQDDTIESRDDDNEPGDYANKA